MPTVILKKKPLYFSCKKKLWNGKFTDYGKGLDIKMRKRKSCETTQQNGREGCKTETI